MARTPPPDPFLHLLARLLFLPPDEAQVLERVRRLARGITVVATWGEVQDGVGQEMQERLDDRELSDQQAADCQGISLATWRRRYRADPTLQEMAIARGRHWTWSAAAIKRWHAKGA